MGEGVTSSLSPNQKASTSLRPIAALATSRMRDAGRDSISGLMSVAPGRPQALTAPSGGRSEATWGLFHHRFCQAGASIVSIASSGQRGRTSKAPSRLPAASPRCARIAAASAIIAPLSVHSASGG
jgi:hypothetical protein